MPMIPVAPTTNNAELRLLLKMMQAKAPVATSMSITIFGWCRAGIGPRYADTHRFVNRRFLPISAEEGGEHGKPSGPHDFIYRGDIE